MVWYFKGNMWGQSWESIADLILPEELLGSNHDFSLEDVVTIANLSVVDMVKRFDGLNSFLQKIFLSDLWY